MTDLIERYGAGKFRYASPGNNQLPVWMLRFLDKDMREAIFTGADAEQQAWEAWNRYAPAFNCYLLCSAELTPALEARDAEIARLNWQPIGTAPKDGTLIDLWVVHTNGLGTVAGGRSTNCSWRRESLTSEGWNDSSGNKLEWRVNPSTIQQGCSPDEGRVVTHWMPLPAPPSAALTGKDDPA